MKKIILASASPRRLEILNSMGYEPVVMPADVDESTVETDPRALVEELSARKCLAVVEQLVAHTRMDTTQELADGVVVLAADTVVAIGGEILGKPVDEDDARAMLNKLSAHTHQVFTGVSIASFKGGEQLEGQNCAPAGGPAAPAGGPAASAVTLASTGAKPEIRTFSVKTDVHVVELTEEDIDEYLASGEAYDKAGAYGIQGLFGKFIDRIDGDYFNVVGLPKAAVYAELKNM